MFKYKRVAIDFDGTLFEDYGSIEETYSSNADLKPKTDANKATQFLKEQGFEILIFTCRPDYHRAYMESLLNKHNIIYDYILFYTKPRVDLYIDDKGYRFHDWQTTQQWIEKHMHE
jgi:hydroxymethylpyrimidine pyrophosphatase-like HAD family hydrolase